MSSPHLNHLPHPPVVLTSNLQHYVHQQNHQCAYFRLIFFHLCLIYRCEVLLRCEGQMGIWIHEYYKNIDLKKTKTIEPKKLWLQNNDKWPWSCLQGAVVTHFHCPPGTRGVSHVTIGDTIMASPLRLSRPLIERGPCSGRYHLRCGK